jgi:hypothetical protein
VIVRKTSLFAALGLWLAPVAGSACVIQLPECQTDYGTAYLYSMADGVVLFAEQSSGSDPQRVMLVECTSRQGVMVVDDPANTQAFWDAVEHFRFAMVDEAPHTLDQIARHARNLGAQASRVQLAAGHCGCDLPSIPAPPTYCPEG